MCQLMRTKVNRWSGPINCKKIERKWTRATCPGCYADLCLSFARITVPLSNTMATTLPVDKSHETRLFRCRPGNRRVVHPTFRTSHFCRCYDSREVLIWTVCQHVCAVLRTENGASTILIIRIIAQTSINQIGPNRLTRLGKTTQTAYFADVNASFLRQFGWFGILVLHL